MKRKITGAAATVALGVVVAACGSASTKRHEVNHYEMRAARQALRTYEAPGIPFLTLTVKHLGRVTLSRQHGRTLASAEATLVAVNDAPGIGVDEGVTGGTVAATVSVPLTGAGKTWAHGNLSATPRGPAPAKTGAIAKATAAVVSLFTLPSGGVGAYDAAQRRFYMTTSKSDAGATAAPPVADAFSEPSLPSYTAALLTRCSTYGQSRLAWPGTLNATAGPGVAAAVNRHTLIPSYLVTGYVTVTSSGWTRDKSQWVSTQVPCRPQAKPATTVEFKADMVDAPRHGWRVGWLDLPKLRYEPGMPGDADAIYVDPHNPDPTQP